jgi:phage gp46-like protein
MAQDIELKFDEVFLEGDIEYLNGDLVRESGLKTAVMISLFTDRRAGINDPLDNPNDKRGWWGDLIPDNGDRIGSKLWQYERSKVTQEVVLKVKQSIEECLKWMVEDQVAKSIEVIVEKFGEVGNYRLGVTIKIYKSIDGEEEIKFDDLWEAQLAIY